MPSVSRKGRARDARRSSLDALGGGRAERKPERCRHAPLAIGRKAQRSLRAEQRGEARAHVGDAHATSRWGLESDAIVADRDLHGAAVPACKDAHLASRGAWADAMLDRV